MKKVILLIVSCILMHNTMAQPFNVKIEQKYIGQSAVIYTTVTNTTSCPVHVVDGSWISNDGGIESSGNTYIVFSSYDANNKLLETSQEIPFTISDPEVRKPNIKFAIGQSITAQRLLFTETGVIGIFNRNKNVGIRLLKAKIHVTYWRPGLDDSFQYWNVDVGPIYCSVNIN